MNMPRRSSKNAHLKGTNLYYSGDYLYYRNPNTNEKTYLTGIPEDEAIKMALKTNTLLEKKPEIVLGDDYIPTLLDRFEADFLPDQNYSESYLKEIKFKLNKYRRDCEGIYLRDWGVLELKNYFTPLSPHSRKLNRILWISIFKFAISEGLTKENAAQMTLSKKTPPRERERLDMAGYEAIYAIAPEWFQIAMDVVLLTLQRREVTKIKLTDYQDGVLQIVQGKTGTPLKIEANASLHAVIERSKKTRIVAPHLIHKNPGRKIKPQKGRHWAQVSPETLTRTFAKLREKTGLFSDLPANKKPTFYEIKSLGGRLLKKQLMESGHTKDEADGFVQMLMGHEDKATTQIYLEDGSIQWKMVEARLKR